MVGLPARAYTPSRGWTDADMDAGFERLTRRGLMTAGEQLTDAGRAFREEVEVGRRARTTRGRARRRPRRAAAHLDPWSEAIIAARSYPKRIAGVYNVGGGPHFGSGLTIDTAAEIYDNKT